MTYRTLYIFKYIFCILVCSAYTLQAESGENADTLRVYKLGEVVASDARDSDARAAIAPATTNKLGLSEIRSADAVSVSQLAAQIPAGNVQTNSRGESLLFLRGAGERQIALYLDGALLNIPWDNRIDLSLIPTDIVGGITVSKGASSILYGANILGGAVNITTVERAADGFGGRVRLQGSEAASYRAAALVDGRSGDVSYLAYAGYLQDNGYLLPGDVQNLGNQNPDSRLRTNTDQERASAFARVEYALSDRTTLALAVNYIDAEKGVAPEAHKDTVSGPSPRFWRLPEWRRIMTSLHGEHAFSDARDLTLRGAVWFDKFSQTIEQYQSIRFEDIAAIEDNDDNTIGGRFALAWTPNKRHALTFAVSGYSSLHEETIAEDGATERNDFEQLLYSAGAEYKLNIGDWRFTAGATFDGSSTPQTGPFPDQDGQTDFGALLGAEYYISPTSYAFANVSRRTRFPTLREQFSGALGKFLPNPDLQAENGILTEIGFVARPGKWRLQSAVFGNFYRDGMEKITIEVDGATLEQRINIAESIGIGVETSLQYPPTQRSLIEGHFTYLYARGKDEEGGDFDRKLEYKPEILATLIATYFFPWDLTVAAEARATGEQFGSNSQTDEFETLDATVVANLRFTYRLPLVGGVIPTLFLRVNNVFDQVSFTQLGLPNAGRMITGGAYIDF